MQQSKCQKIWSAHTFRPELTEWSSSNYLHLPQTQPLELPSIFTAYMYHLASKATLTLTLDQTIEYRYSLTKSCHPLRHLVGEIRVSSESHNQATVAFQIIECVCNDQSSVNLKKTKANQDEAPKATLKLVILHPVECQRRIEMCVCVCVCESTHLQGGMWARMSDSSFNQTEPTQTWSDVK